MRVVGGRVLSYASFPSCPLCDNKGDKKRVELQSIPADPITPSVLLKGHMRAALTRIRRRRTRRLIEVYTAWRVHRAYMGVTPLYIIFKALTFSFLMSCMPLVFRFVKGMTEWRSNFRLYWFKSQYFSPLLFLVNNTKAIYPFLLYYETMLIKWPLYVLWKQFILFTHTNTTYVRIHNTIRYDTIRYNTIQYDTIHNTIQYYNTLQYNKRMYS